MNFALFGWNIFEFYSQIEPFLYYHLMNIGYLVEYYKIAKKWILHLLLYSDGSSLLFALELFTFPFWADYYIHWRLVSIIDFVSLTLLVIWSCG